MQSSTKKIFKCCFCAALLVLLLSALNVSAEGTENPSYNLNEPLPRDAKVVVGKLENGLSYYIRKNKRPENRAELRLAVNAGSILEDEDQRGLAHFLEHMAFNGTEHFRKQELVNWLESIGMRFGPETNAYTAFDETVYQLEVPTDKKETLEKAMLILSDWSHAITLDAEDVEKERGVILEEWRLGRGGQARVRDKQYPTLLKDSKYAERLPIGKPEIIKTANAETLRRFYRDWYRPDLMAVIAVGDFDPVLMEKLIKDQFSHLRNPASSRPRIEAKVPDHDEFLFSSASDPELSRISLGMYVKRPALQVRTLGDYRNRLAEILFTSMLNNRLTDISRKPDAPFLYASVGSLRLTRPKTMYYAVASVEDDDVETGFSALLEELGRVRLHGFASSELDRAKAEYLRRSEQTNREAENLSSSLFVSTYVDNFLLGSPITGPENGYELSKRLLPGIDEADLKRFASRVFEDGSLVLLVSAPEKSAASLPGERTFRDLAAKAAEKKLEAYQDEAPAGPLLAETPKPGLLKRINDASVKVPGTAEWKAGNGVRVILKTTTFKNDEILMAAYSPGGTSLVSDADYVSADFASSVVSRSGLGNFSEKQLEKYLSDKRVRFETVLSDVTEGFQGAASVRDLETLLQLVYLSFTAPRYDADAVAAYIRQIRASLKNQENDPDVVYANTIQETLTQGHVRGRPYRAKLLDELDPKKAFEIFRDRFGDAGDFTFLFVGSIEPERFEPLVAAYLASLPSQGRKETFRDVGPSLPKRSVEKTVRAGIEQKSYVSMYFTGSLSWSYETEFALGALKEYLEIRLRESLREDQGGTYDVAVNVLASRYPRGEYYVEISFGASPDRLQDLVARALAEVETMKTSLPDEKITAKVREQAFRLHERGLKENGFWLEHLRNIAYNDLPGDLVKTIPELIRKIDPTAIKAAVAEFCRPESLVKVVLYPEK